MTKFQEEQWRKLDETDFKAVPMHGGKTACIVAKDPTIADLELLKTYIGLWIDAKRWRPPPRSSTGTA